MISQKTKNRVGQTVKQSLKLIIQVLPLMICGILMSAAISSLLPPETAMKLVGNEAGSKSIFIGSAAGALVPGEPFFSLPIAQGLAKVGAGYGALVAFIASWALFSITLYPLEIAFLGLRFTLLRSLVNLFIPILSGIIACLIP